MSDTSPNDSGYPGPSASTTYENTVVAPPRSLTEKPPFGEGKVGDGSTQGVTAPTKAATPAAPSGVGISPDDFVLDSQPGSPTFGHLMGFKRTIEVDPGTGKTVYGYETLDLGDASTAAGVAAIAAATGIPAGTIGQKIAELRTLNARTQAGQYGTFLGANPDGSFTYQDVDGTRKTTYNPADMAKVGISVGEIQKGIAQVQETNRTLTQAGQFKVESAQYDANGNLVYNVSDFAGHVTAEYGPQLEEAVRQGKVPGVTPSMLQQAQYHAQDMTFQTGQARDYTNGLFGGGMYTPPAYPPPSATPSPGPTPTPVLPGRPDAGTPPLSPPPAAYPPGTPTPADAEQPVEGAPPSLMPGGSGGGTWDTGATAPTTPSTPTAASGLDLYGAPTPPAQTQGSAQTQGGAASANAYQPPPYSMTTQGSSGGATTQGNQTSTATGSGSSGYAGGTTTGGYASNAYTLASNPNASVTGQTNQQAQQQNQGMQNQYDRITMAYKLANLPASLNDQTRDLNQRMLTQQQAGMSRDTQGTGFGSIQSQQKLAGQY